MNQAMFGRRAATAFASAALFALLSGSPALAQEKLIAGVDGTFAPHAMPKLGGGVEGFNIDMINAIGQ